MQKIQILNTSSFPNPEYKTTDSSGVDLTINRGGVLLPNKIKIFSTGIYINIPRNNEYLIEAQVRTRSSLAKEGIIVLNAPGTIDNDYNGEIKIILYNATHRKKEFKAGARIAQLIFSRVERIEWVNVEKFEEDKDNNRNLNGFGSTGLY